jgi:hypothetical protein
MPSPTNAINRFDLSLSYGEFNLLANRQKFVGLNVFPPVTTLMESASFLRVKIASLLGPVRDTQRAPRTGYKRDDFQWDTDSYKTEDHGWEAELDDRQIKRYGEIRAERLASMRAINNVLLRYEYDCAAAAFSTSFFNNTGKTRNANATVAWGTKATADPIADIDTAVETVAANCGSPPNTMVLTDIALRKLIRTDRVEGLLKYSGNDDPKLFYRALPALAELLRIERILVAQGFKNTAGEGQTATMSRLWDSTIVGLFNVNNDGMDGDLEAPMPNIGRTIMWQDEAAPLPGDDSGAIGVIVEEYRDDTHRGNVFRARNDRQIKQLHADAGYLITSV